MILENYRLLYSKQHKNFLWVYFEEPWAHQYCTTRSCCAVVVENEDDSGRAAAQPPASGARGGGDSSNWVGAVLHGEAAAAVRPWGRGRPIGGAVEKKACGRRGGLRSQSTVATMRCGDGRGAEEVDMNERT
jgi:hypothetical protein